MFPAYVPINNLFKNQIQCVLPTTAIRLHVYGLMPFIHFQWCPAVAWRFQPARPDI
jgi:hypothetical protein